MPKLYGMMRDKPRTATLQVDDETATITYRMALIPSGHYRDMLAGRWANDERTSEQEAEYTRWMQVALSAVIVSWDVLREDGTAWPTTDTEDGIQRVPPAFLAAAWQVIQNDFFFPNPSGGGITSADSKHPATPATSET